MNAGDKIYKTIKNAKTKEMQIIEYIITQEDVDCYDEQCLQEELAARQLTEDESSRLKLLDMMEIAFNKIIELEGAINNVN